MKRKYPAKMFLLFILTNFVFHFFYLFIPGIIFCIIGIWSKTCLYIGLGILLADFILSVVEQIRIRNAAVSQSDGPEFNELMDAFCNDGLEAVRDVIDSKIQSQRTDMQADDSEE